MVDQASHRPALFGAVAASVGVMIGALGPWVTLMLFTVSGLDASSWGLSTLTLGALSGFASIIILFGTRTPLNARWSLPLSCGVAVAGLACLTVALPTLLKVLTSAKTTILGVTFGPTPGWGLWLLTISSAALCATGILAAAQIAKSVELHEPGQSTAAWVNTSRWAAVITGAVVVLAGIAYFTLNWNGGVSDHAPSTGDFPSFMGDTPN